MGHRHAGIALTVREPCQGSHCVLRHQFTDEYDTPSQSATHVEAQIHFFKGLMKGHGMPHHLCLVELKSDEAHVGDALKLVEFSARRDVTLKQNRIHGIIEHHEVLPFSGKKRALLSWSFHAFMTVPELKKLHRIRRGGGTQSSWSLCGAQIQ